MPVVTTYPGVYIEEIPSGVHTITGASTAVAAFVGAAKTGPINVATHIFAPMDFERAFGGLDSNAEMSYAVRQFFNNGGSEAWIVRVSPGAAPATAVLKDATPANVLTLTAVPGGAAGNSITYAVDYNTPVGGSTFNLSLRYASPNEPANQVTETLQNLSMNALDSRFVSTIVNGTSVLVTAAPAALAPATNATSASGLLTDAAVKLLIGAADPPRTLRVSLNGGAPVTVTLAHNDVNGGLAGVATAIQTQVSGAQPGDPYTRFACAANGSNDRIVLTLGGGPLSADSIRVLPGTTNDISVGLKLGSANGGSESDPFAAHRPAPLYFSGTLVGRELTDDDLSNAKGGAPGGSFTIALDGDATTHKITLGDHTSIKDARTRLSAIAQEIAGAVQSLGVTGALGAAYARFSARVTPDNRLLLQSGSTGTSSAVKIGAGAPTDVSAELGLAGAGSTAYPGSASMLAGGVETAPPWSDAQIYPTFVPARSTKGGIYALEGIDFNLLVLAGITNAATLIDSAAYCEERRAFLIADAPQGQTPAAMATLVAGPTVPKSDHAALYYPWISIADPLAGGALTSHPPSGTIAGIYARTDATRGVWKAPAGIDATLTGAQGVQYALTDGEHGSLNPLGLNCVRAFPVYGVVSWGARTLRGADVIGSDYKYVPVRRLANFIELSLLGGTKWIVFEPNDEPLWSQIRLNIGAFMNNLFVRGAFQGKTPRDAYFVKCDADTTTQNDINLGVVNIIVGFAPLKPAEFVVIQIQQIAGQIAT